MNGSTTLQLALQKWAMQKGDALSIIETATDKKLSYQQLLSAIAAIQKFLGDTPQTVIIATPGGIVNTVVWLTTLLYGHHLVPISPNTTAYEYEELLTKCTPTLLITETDSWITDTSTKHITLSDIEELLTKWRVAKTTLATDAHLTDGTVYLETSGTTGKPKGMLLSASQIVITAENIAKVHKLSENDRGLTPLPFFHVNAPIVSMITAVLTGSTAIIAPRFSARLFWEWVEQYDPTWISIVPTIVAILLKFDKPVSLEKSSLRFIRTASAPLPKANLTKFEEKFGFPLIETYGISEGASTIFANPLPPKMHKPGSVGLPLDGLETKIIDPNTGNTIPQGKIGEVCVKGKQLIIHYEEGRGKDSFQDGWFHTGDLGYFDEDRYLFLTGRKKEIIIRGGENIIPREIEEILLTYPGIVEAAVVGHPDTILGEKVVAFVEIEEKSAHTLPEEIIKFIAEKLSPQKVPAEVYLIDALPRGKTNKIDKNKLKKLTPSSQA